MSDYDELLPLGTRVARALLRARRLPAMSLPRFGGRAGAAGSSVAAAQLLAGAPAVAGPAGLLGVRGRVAQSGLVGGGARGALLGAGFANASVASLFGGATAVSGRAHALLAGGTWDLAAGCAAPSPDVTGSGGATDATGWLASPWTRGARALPWWTGGARAIPAPGFLPPAAPAGLLAVPAVAGSVPNGWVAGQLSSLRTMTAGADGLVRVTADLEQRVNALERGLLGRVVRGVSDAV